MYKSDIWILITTLALAGMIVLCSLNSFYALIGLLFLTSPILVLGMVYSVLKDKRVPNKTFETHFYQDSEIKKQSSGD
jgi:hypothetical protein